MRCARMGESPMARFKRLLNFTVFLAIALATQSWLITNAQTPDSKPRPTASITGRVTIGEKPAPGMLVVVSTVNSFQTPVGQSLSDAEGKYRINGLLPGQIIITAAAPTYVLPAQIMYGMGRLVNLSTDE